MFARHIDEQPSIQEVEIIDGKKALMKILDALRTEEEEIEGIKNYGFTVKSSLKDLYRILLQVLMRKLSGDLVINILNNWEDIINAKSISELANVSDIEFQVAKEAYFQVRQYFYDQLATHLGEKIVFDNSLVEDEILRSFVEKHGLKQRKFSNRLDNRNLFTMLQSAVRCAVIKRNEREYCEFYNLLFLYLQSVNLSVDQLELLRLELISSMPDKEVEINEVFRLGINEQIEPGDVLVEVSPPLPEYEHQTDLMLRIYTKHEDGYTFNQYSLPYSLEETFKSQEDIASQGKQVNTNNPSDVTNQVLAKLTQFKVIGDKDILENYIVNAFLRFQNPNVNVGLIDKNDSILMPFISSTMTRIEPFIDRTLQSLPNIFMDKNALDDYIQHYTEVLLSAIATNDINIQEENREVREALISGQLLETAVEGGNTSQVLKDASGGAVSSMEVTSIGDCDIVSGVIGSQAAQSTATITQADISNAIKAVENLGISYSNPGNLNLEVIAGKNGEKLTFFNKLNQETGKVERHILCPVCGKDSLDVCNLSQVCKGCQYSCEQIKSSYDKGQLNRLIKRYKIDNDDGDDFFTQLFKMLFGFGIF